MRTDALWQLARQTTESIQDDVLSARAWIQLSGLEHACGLDPENAVGMAERLIVGQCDPVASAILACDLAQAVANLGHDPYRFLEFARSTAIGNSIRAEIYIGLVEAKLGIHPERRLRWAEACAEVDEQSDWLAQTQAAVARIQAGAGDWIAARQTVARIDDPLQQLASNCELAISAHEEGNHRAIDLLPQVGNITRLRGNVRAKCILTVTAHCLGLNSSTNLRELVDVASQLRGSPQYAQAAALIAPVLARCQQLNHALRMIDPLAGADRLEALLAMCQETAQAGNVADTRELAGQLMIPGYRDRALYCVVAAAAKAVA